MKRVKEFKGYQTTTEYDEAAGQFTDRRVEHEGFEDQETGGASETPAAPAEDNKHEMSGAMAIAAE